MKTNGRSTSVIPAALAVLLLVSGGVPSVAQVSPVVDTNQAVCYDATDEISCPAEGQAFYGQDAQYDGNLPWFSISSDGLTVYDGVIEYEDKMSFWDAQNRPAALNAMNYGGYSDWRLPSIKEMYSLIDFSGVDPSGWSGGTAGLIPFIDTDYFGFEYGDGIDEIVTGAGPGSVFGVHVRGWNYDGSALESISGINFFAWPSDEARYGARVYAGTDLDDDGRDELVVGPGPDPEMASPVKVYQYDGSIDLLFSLQAYPDGWMEGASVAAGRF